MGEQVQTGQCSLQHDCNVASWSRLSLCSTGLPASCVGLASSGVQTTVLTLLSTAGDLQTFPMLICHRATVLHMSGQHVEPATHLGSLGIVKSCSCPASKGRMAGFYCRVAGGIAYSLASHLTDGLFALQVGPIKCYPLYSTLPPAQQQRIFEPVSTLSDPVQCIPESILSAESLVLIRWPRCTDFPYLQSQTSPHLCRS